MSSKQPGRLGPGILSTATVAVLLAVVLTGKAPVNAEIVAKG